ncbi:DUF1572 family protein [Muricauda sp. CAU 1633]|uniref:DUF1572 family protein n=1 Tax=Allomuricauda sp. CAU 1633 TaxID=2816036 RepID=UPI001A8E5486|nr:DUF1572 family protein [Muricauda sp. CAU 1633]MBO0324021.1 DUF1572 family protein [Muricauda sp. CAU 1633]
MILDALVELFERDLNKLKEEINLYTREENLWVVEHNIANCGGNLCLHLIGNLNAFIGAGLANSGYIRQRDDEFSLKNVSKSELIEGIDQTIAVVSKGLNSLEESDLNNDFPILVWEKPIEMGKMLIHLHSHLNYHLGQINYHRRLLDKT